MIKESYLKQNKSAFLCNVFCLINCFFILLYNHNAHNILGHSGHLDICISIPPFTCAESLFVTLLILDGMETTYSNGIPHVHLK